MKTKTNYAYPRGRYMFTLHSSIHPSSSIKVNTILNVGLHMCLGLWAWKEIYPNKHQDQDWSFNDVRVAGQTKSGIYHFHSQEVKGSKRKAKQAIFHCQATNVSNREEQVDEMSHHKSLIWFQGLCNFFFSFPMYVWCVNDQVHIIIQQV